ncbi:NIPA-like protein 2 isoform X2 [Oenanthe melanoleuca]|uniref:NIPA-like protein 2 isoform X2 n=1 Tax=Oenanthe melanoleuca TaxID=2939378 RepID=UPI0024C1B7A9|nr:NIPA-like protein 2 isoform X2 [Oenanthe melanoleuca]
MASGWGLGQGHGHQPRHLECILWACRHRQRVPVWPLVQRTQDSALGSFTCCCFKFSDQCLFEYTGSAFISVFFLKRTMRTADILGGTLTITGIYLLVAFTPNVPQELTARQVQNYLVSWPFLGYSIVEIIIFCILLYFYKRKAVKHIMVLLMMVALLASLTVIAVKAVSSMIALSVMGKMQLTCSIFYIMSVLMATSCAFQIKFLNQAVHLYEAIAVVPINFVFFTTSAIISGVIFYREFQSATLLSVFMFLFGCLLSFLGVIIIARNKKEEHLQIPFIDCGHIPGQKLTGKIQPDSHSSCYGTLNKEDDSVKRQS